MFSNNKHQPPRRRHSYTIFEQREPGSSLNLFPKRNYLIANDKSHKGNSEQTISGEKYNGVRHKHVLRRRYTYSAIECDTVLPTIPPDTIRGTEPILAGTLDNTVLKRRNSEKALPPIKVVNELCRRYSYTTISVPKNIHPLHDTGHMNTAPGANTCRTHPLDEKTGKTAALFRRNSEIMLHQVKAVSTRRQNDMTRRNSMISIPNEMPLTHYTGLNNTTLTRQEKVWKQNAEAKLSENNNPPPPNSSDSSDSSVDLHRTPSAEPVPRQLKQNKSLDDLSELGAEDRFMQMTSYRPKYCWCLRCQLMYTMYKTKDEKLMEWGNYPCFRR